MENNKNLYYLVDHLIKTINLPDFIEREADVSFKWRKNNQSASCHCPMPNHNDRNASFHVNLMSNNVFIFHCFGCHVKGNIIHFCMNYYSLRNKLESILFLCKKFNIKNKEDLIVQSLKTITKKVDLQRKLENANIMVSNQCRMLLRKDFNLYSKWVAKTYIRLNKALDEDDYETIENIGYEASNKISEVV